MCLITEYEILRIVWIIDDNNDKIVFWGEEKFKQSMN